MHTEIVQVGKDFDYGNHNANRCEKKNVRSFEGVNINFATNILTSHVMSEQARRPHKDTQTTEQTQEETQSKKNDVRAWLHTGRQPHPPKPPVIGWKMV